MNETTWIDIARSIFLWTGGGVIIIALISMLLAELDRRYQRRETKKWIDMRDKK